MSALSAGGRFIRSSPVVRRILLRALLFIAPASALWGLLAVIASRQLHLSSAGYGVLLGALGVGAVCGATVLSRLLTAFGRNVLLTVGAVAYLCYGALMIATSILVFLVNAQSWLVDVASPLARSVRSRCLAEGCASGTSASGP